MSRWLPLIALGLLSACGETLDPGSRVNSMRVLAQGLDVPYAQPGETVHVSSLAFDPEARDVQWAWAMCVNPSSSQVDGCIAKIVEDGAGAGTLPLLAQGVGIDSVDVPVPTDAISALPIAARPTASVGVLSIACPGTLSFEKGSSGLPFRCVEAGGRELGLDEFVVGMKRIAVRTVDRNANPAIANVTFDGADWPADEVKNVSACGTDGNEFGDCAEKFQHALVVNVTPDSYERGQTEFGEPFEEQLVLQYYATEGIFESDARIAESPKNKWVARKQSAGKDLTFWFVARDNRGGVTWTTRRVHVD